MSAPISYSLCEISKIHTIIENIRKRTLGFHSRMGLSEDKKYHAHEIKVFAVGHKYIGSIHIQASSRPFIKDLETVDSDDAKLSILRELVVSE